MTAIALDKFQVSDKGRALTRLTADVAVYLDHSLSAHHEALLRCLELFYTIVPKAQLEWYSTESMTRDKPCTARTFGIPKVWWQKKPPEQRRFLQIKGCEESDGVARCGLRVSAHELEEGDQLPWAPSLVRFMLPAERVLENPAPLLELAHVLLNELPAASGHAGFCIERNEAYHAWASMVAAFPLAMRHPGADIDYRLAKTEFSFLKTVNWLTLVGDPLLERIGGRAALRDRLGAPGILVHEAKHGLIAQAGSKPQLGDVNRGETLPEYRAVYRALAELFAPTFTPAFHATTPHDDFANAEKTEAWYRRFASEVP